MTELQREADGMIGRIQRHQAVLKLSDKMFVARYQRYLLSAKSWRQRLVARNWEEIGRALPKWMQRLRKFVAELDGTAPISDFIEELPIAQYGAEVYQMLQGEQSDRRIAWLIGPTGVGKSWTMKRLASDFARDSAYVMVQSGSKSSQHALARMLALAVGAAERSGGAAMFESVLETLKGKQVTLLIDDIHEGGVPLLKMVKNLIDTTWLRVVAGTYPTAWRALCSGSTDAQAEAQQLLGRSLRPINERWKKGVTPEDVFVYLAGKLADKEERAVAAGQLAPILRANGNLRVMDSILSLAEQNAGDADRELTAEILMDSAKVVCPPQNGKDSDDRR